MGNTPTSLRYQAVFDTAVRNDNLDEFKIRLDAALASGFDVNSLSDNKPNDGISTSHTILAWATAEKNFKIVQELIEKRGANVNGAGDREGSNGNNPLIRALHNNDEAAERIAIYLIDKGANINQKGYLGTTALIRASRYNCINVVRAILSKKEELTILNAVDDDREQSALEYACKAGHTEIIKLLRAAGATETDYTRKSCPVDEPKAAVAALPVIKQQFGFLLDYSDEAAIKTCKDCLAVLKPLPTVTYGFVAYGKVPMVLKEITDYSSCEKALNALKSGGAKVSTNAPPPGIANAITKLSGDEFGWDKDPMTYRAIVHIGATPVDMAKISTGRNSDIFIDRVKLSFASMAEKQLDLLIVLNNDLYKSTAELIASTYDNAGDKLFDATIITAEDKVTEFRKISDAHSIVIARGGGVREAAPLRSGGAGGPSSPPASSSAASVRANGGAGGAAKAPAAAPLRSGGAGGPSPPLASSSAAAAAIAPGPTLAEAIAASAARRAAAAKSPSTRNGHRNTRKNAPTLASVLTGWTSGTPIPEAFFKEENIDHINTSTVATFTAHITSSATYEAVKALRDLMKGDPKSDAKTAFRSKLSEVVNTSPFK